jgi:hypothetical protein
MAVAAFVLVFVTLVVVGVLLSLFSWITAGLPPGVMTCPRAENGVALDVGSIQRAGRGSFGRDCQESITATETATLAPREGIQ